MGHAAAGASENPDPVIARRPATVEWAAAETIIAIGGLPVATASPYRGQTGVTDAFATVPGVGSLFAPDPESLQVAQPDLIFCAQWQQNLVPMLARIAPVHVFDLRAPPDRVLDNTLRLVGDVGRLLGRQAEAQAYLQDAEAGLDGLKERLRLVSTQPVLLGALGADGRHISVFGRGSLFDSVLTRLGLSNAWTGPMNAWGNMTQGVEVLVNYPDTPFLYLDAGPPTIAARQALGASSLWNALPSVRHGRDKAIPFAWLYGGLPTALRFGASLAAALAPDGQRDRG